MFLLDKIVAFIGILAIFLFCFFGCVALYVGMVEWFQLQSEASLIADSMAQYGGYTNIANQHLKTFCVKHGLNPAALSVAADPPGGPVPYGQPVSVTMSYPFNQVVDAGLLSAVVNFPLRVSATGVSHYVQNMVTGASPVQVYYCVPSL